jgi:hypothetical protein
MKSLIYPTDVPMRRLYHHSQNIRVRYGLLILHSVCIVCIALKATADDGNINNVTFPPIAQTSDINPPTKPETSDRTFVRQIKVVDSTVFSEKEPETSDRTFVRQVIRIIEGHVSEIELQGTKRLNPGYIRDRIKLGASIPLNTIQLEDQLKLLRTDPLFTNVEASLRSTGKVGLQSSNLRPLKRSLHNYNQQSFIYIYP